MPTSPTVLSAAVLLGLAPSAAAAPDVDELIDKAVEAMGGKAIQKIESYSVKSEMTAPMGTMTGEVFWAKPDRVLARQTMPGMGGMEMGSDGTVGWMRAVGTPEWQLLEGKGLDQVRQQAMHMRVFRLKDTLKEDFESLDSRGETEFDGVACHELGMKSREGAQEASMFFETPGGLPRGIRVARETPEGPQVMTITFGDWKPVGKVRFFHSMNMAGGGMNFAFRYAGIEVNKVDAAKLAMPEAVAERLKQRAARPEGAPMELEDFSGQVQQMIRGQLDALPWDDAEGLRARRAEFAAQVERLPGEFKDGMKYVIRRIDERLKELAGGG